MTPWNIELHIEELVLRGFAAKDRYAIGEAMQRELQRLFAEQGVPLLLAQGYELAQLDAGAFNVKPGSKADEIGTQVAQSIYGGLSK